MRIKTRFAPTQTNWFGFPVKPQFIVSVVGDIPGLPTHYVEQDVGVVSDRSKAPAAVGRYIQSFLQNKAIEDLVSQGVPHDDAEQMVALKGVRMPAIPGVTTEGEWKNKPFGNPDAHRARLGLKEHQIRHSA